MITELNPFFWDCDCHGNYIHPKSHLVCPLCGRWEEDGAPDSYQREIVENPDRIALKPGDFIFAGGDVYHVDMANSPEGPAVCSRPTPAGWSNRLFYPSEVKSFFIGREIVPAPWLDE